MSKFRFRWLLCGALLVLLVSLAVRLPGALRGPLQAVKKTTEGAWFAITSREEGPKALAREQAACRAAGIPLSPAELPTSRLTPNENAAPIYARLVWVLRARPLAKYVPTPADLQRKAPRHPVEELLIRQLREDARWPAEYLQKDPRTTSYYLLGGAQKLLDSRQDVMQLIRQAADRPGCDFARDWSRGPVITAQEYSVMRESARLLRTEAILHARWGRYEQAVQDLVRARRVADHAGSDPWVMGYLVSKSIHSIALSGFADILRIAGPNAAVAGKVATAIRQHPAHLDLHRAIIGEIAVSKGIFNQLRAGGSSTMSARRRTSRLGMVDAWEADYLQHSRALAEGAKQPLTTRAALGRRLYNDLDKNTSTAANMTQIMLPAGILQAGDDPSAREAVVLAAASVLRYRARHGVFPDSLAELTKVPTDPYTGKLLGYRREGNGFVVYSEGVNQTFNGGRPGGKAPKNEAVFRYPATPVTHNDAPAGGV